MTYTIEGEKEITFNIKEGDVYEDLEIFFKELYTAYSIIDKKGFRKEVEELIFSINDKKIDLDKYCSVFYDIVDRYMES